MGLSPFWWPGSCTVMLPSRPGAAVPAALPPSAGSNGPAETRHLSCSTGAGPASLAGDGQCLADDLQRVPGRPPGPVPDLLPAGDAGRRDDRPLRLGPDGGEESEPADAHGQLVVLGLEPERSGHPAAPGVDLGDVGARDAAEQGHRRGGARERLLVA